MYIYSMGKVKKEMVSAMLSIKTIENIEKKVININKTNKGKDVTRHYLIVQALEKEFGK